MEYIDFFATFFDQDSTKFLPQDPYSHQENTVYYQALLFV